MGLLINEAAKGSEPEARDFREVGVRLDFGRGKGLTIGYTHFSVMGRMYPAASIIEMGDKLPRPIAILSEESRHSFVGDTLTVFVNRERDMVTFGSFNEGSVDKLSVADFLRGFRNKRV